LEEKMVMERLKRKGFQTATAKEGYSEGKKLTGMSVKNRLRSQQLTWNEVGERLKERNQGNPHVFLACAPLQH
jgi:hypothetical protein